MARKKRRAADTQDVAAHKRDHLWFMGTGLAIGVALATMRDTLLGMNPWAVGALWAAAATFVIIGVTRTNELRRYVRVAAMLGISYVAFQFWHSTSAHARIEILDTRRFQRPGNVDSVNVDYTNSGKWAIESARFGATYRFIDAAQARDNQLRSKQEDDIHRTGLRSDVDDVHLADIPAGAKRTITIPDYARHPVPQDTAQMLIRGFRTRARG